MEPTLSYHSIGSQILENDRLIGADVGASHFLPAHWHRFIGNTLFYLFEPHEQTRVELERLCARTGRPEDFRVVGVALSGKGGNRFLFKTNAPTGSSLLEPNLNAPGLAFDDDYLFPITVEPLATKTLREVLDSEGKKEMHIIKLDTQGTELEILSGLDSSRLQSLLAVESEIGLAGIYVGQTNFPDFDRFMGSIGMELYDIRVNRYFTKRSRKAPYFQEIYLKTSPQSASVAARAYELDVVYFRNPASLLESGNTRMLRKLILCYCVYNYFADALRLAEFCRDGGLMAEGEFANCVEQIRQLHTINQQQTNVVDQILNVTHNQIYSQYTWLPYPE